MKPNVELVAAGIQEIVPEGIVTQHGRTVELDTIVFATGFDPMNPPHFRNVVGRGGRSIREAWDADGVRAYLGTVIPGFPNHFTLLCPNTASGNNSALQPIGSSSMRCAPLSRRRPGAGAGSARAACRGRGHEVLWATSHSHARGRRFETCRAHRQQSPGAAVTCP